MSSAERRALLSGNGSIKDAPTRTPLPWRQLSIVFLIRLAEPISFSVIYPFVNEMIASLGITSNPAEVGYYAGTIEGCFALAQFLTVLSWGRLSDKWGRRPVILVGIAGVTLSTAVFGFGKSFWALLGARLINGALNGNVPALKSCVGEITDSTNTAYAFSIMPMFYAIGTVIGPALGGYLPRPAERYPKWFGGVWFWEEYPYALPCLVASGITFSGWVVGLFLLEESLESRKRPKANDTLLQAEANLRITEEPLSGPSPSSLLQATPGNANYGGTSTPTPSTRSLATLSAAEPLTISQILKLKVVKSVLLSYGMLAFVAVGHDALWTLWQFTPVGKGGLGFSTASIGTSLSLYGVLVVVIQLLFFAPLQTRYGTIPLLRFFLGGYTLVALLAPIISWIATLRIPDSPGRKRSADGDWMVWAGVVVLVVLKASSNCAFAATNILVNNSPPTKSSLGSINGLAQMTASFFRTVGPALFNSIFAFSAPRNILGGQLAWYVLAAFGGLAMLSAFYAIDGVEERKKLELESST